ncbi:MAG: enoyl-CoA hydratase family protein [Acidimicrobiales bacterium]|nr:enoyl-CoA hydratase family protein [Acidimicrobiales bacterium]
MSADELVHCTIERAVATITLDAPERRNALSAQLVDELTAHLDAALAQDVRAVVLTHTTSTFCAGADLVEAAEPGGPERGTARTLALLRKLVEVPVPVVALIDGNVRAGGLGVVGACDIAFAGPGSSFAFTEAKLGLAPAMISLTVLPRLTDRGAARWFLTAETFGADEAARIGLVTEVADDVQAAAAVVLDSLRACSPQGLAETKALATRAVLEAFDRRAHDLAAQSARLFASGEAAEGIAAFKERRPPRWTIA